MCVSVCAYTLLNPNPDIFVLPTMLDTWRIYAILQDFTLFPRGDKEHVRSQHLTSMEESNERFSN